MSSLSRDERRLRSIKRENSALFFVKGRALFFVKGREETEVNKERKQCIVLCQGMRGDWSIKMENSALFFVKGREKTKVNKRRK